VPVASAHLCSLCRTGQCRRNYGDRGVHCTPQVQDLYPLYPPNQRCGLCQNFNQTTSSTRLYKVRTNLYPHLRKRSDAPGTGSMQRYGVRPSCCSSVRPSLCLGMGPQQQTRGCSFATERRANAGSATLSTYLLAERKLVNLVLIVIIRYR